MSFAKGFLKRSVWVFHLNGGGCNGCDIEIIAALMPRFDAERFGVKLVGSPKMADVILVTGPGNLQNKERLKNIYEQVPNPKAVVVVGACGSTAGVFAGGYNNLGGADRAIPVDYYVAGCPPRPEAILKAVLMAAGKLVSK
jgi:membrane-bound hydrogenase subunit mbhJ